ncbi:hypothetical protein M9Y10_024860 [Tritrichomonas musculus]|uniref:Uncharacterized protein n=1 Tax=Tritrichomonas musculus TaxID=1915356 RepID=A0ABR2HBE7_9EUKA
MTKTDKYLKAKYPQYFQPEIKPFISEKWFPKDDPSNWQLMENQWVEEIKKELPENSLYEKRKEGENNSQICELIRNGMITEIVAYVTRNDGSLNSKVQPSIYETNSFLLKRQIQNRPDNERFFID